MKARTARLLIVCAAIGALFAACNAPGDLLNEIERLVNLPPGPGDLDPSFGTDGVVTTAAGSEDSTASGLAVASSGAIYVAGELENSTDCDFALVRYTAAGVLDSTFGSGGVIATPIGSEDDGATEVAVQADGKIVVCGYSQTGGIGSFAVARYNANGSLDTTFSGDGKLTTSIGSASWPEAVAVQADGKILVAGGRYDGSDDAFALVRYNSDGSLDAGFGTSGVVVTEINADYGDTIYAVALQADGKILVAGLTSTWGSSDIALIRYQANGALDASFGTGGIVVTDIGGGYDDGHALALQADGRILVAGQATIGSTTGGIVVRYDAAGDLDTTFGSGSGYVVPKTGSAEFVAVDGEGRIVVAGGAFAVARLLSSGASDTSFSDDGWNSVRIGTPNGVRAGALQAAGRILLAGEAVINTVFRFALARFLP